MKLFETVLWSISSGLRWSSHALTSSGLLQYCKKPGMILQEAWYEQFAFKSCPVPRKFLLLHGLKYFWRSWRWTSTDHRCIPRQPDSSIVAAILYFGVAKWVGCWNSSLFVTVLYSLPPSYTTISPPQWLYQFQADPVEATLFPLNLPHLSPSPPRPTIPHTHAPSFTLWLLGYWLLQKPVQPSRPRSL